MSERNKIISILCCLSLIILFAEQIDGRWEDDDNEPDSQPRRYNRRHESDDESEAQPSRHNHHHRRHNEKSDNDDFVRKPRSKPSRRARKNKLKNFKQTFDADSPDYHQYKKGNAHYEDENRVANGIGQALFLPGMGWGDGMGNVGGNMPDSLGR